MTGKETSPVVESLNNGFPKREIFYGREVTTGICKMPVSNPLYLNKEGFEGNGVRVVRDVICKIDVILDGANSALNNYIIKVADNKLK